MIGLIKNKKGQWYHTYGGSLLHSKRQRKIVLTGYLAENGYGDIDWLANFWGVTKITAADYLEASERISVDSTLKEQIKKIRDKHNCSIPEAVQCLG